MVAQPYLGIVPVPEVYVPSLIDISAPDDRPVHVAPVLYTTRNIGGRGVRSLKWGGPFVPEAVLTTVRGNRRFVFLNHPPRPIYGRADVCYLRRSKGWQVRPHVPPFDGRGCLFDENIAAGRDDLPLR